MAKVTKGKLLNVLKTICCVICQLYSTSTLLLQAAESVFLFIQVFSCV